MASKKGKRPLIHLMCPVCKSRNYVTKKNVINTPDKLEFKKFCKICKKYTLHKEVKIPSAKK